MRAMSVYVDGGCYTIADIAIESTKAVITCGIGANLEFEEQLGMILNQKQATHVPFFAYDPYVGNFSNLEISKQIKMQVRKVGCGRLDDSSGEFEVLTLRSILQRENLLSSTGESFETGMGGGLFLKMDIEWSEWQVFDSPEIDAELLNHFDQIIIEFHGLLDNEEPPFMNSDYFDPQVSARDFSSIDINKIMVLLLAETHCNTLQHTASYMQHTATHCNTLHTLHHTVPHCNALLPAETHSCRIYHI